MPQRVPLGTGHTVRWKGAADGTLQGTGYRPQSWRCVLLLSGQTHQSGVVKNFSRMYVLIIMHGNRLCQATRNSLHEPCKPWPPLTIKAPHFHSSSATEMRVWVLLHQTCYLLLQLVCHYLLAEFAHQALERSYPWVTHRFLLYYFGNVGSVK